MVHSVFPRRGHALDLVDTCCCVAAVPNMLSGSWRLSLTVDNRETSIFKQACISSADLRLMMMFIVSKFAIAKDLV